MRGLFGGESLIRLEVAYGQAVLVQSSAAGRRMFGVPGRGPFDALAARLANRILGNHPDAATLELALSQVELVADEPALLCLQGAVCPLWGDGPSASPALVRLEAGSRVAIEPPTNGCRCNVALPGGVVELDGGFAAGWRGWPEVMHHHRLEPFALGKGPVRFVRGPEADGFELEKFCAAQFEVSHQSDRRGIRLGGPRMAERPEMASRPTVAGTIQIARGGLPIVLGPDGPTVGGYPRMGVVSRADLSRLAQAKPGDLIRFAQISITDARSAWTEACAEVERRARQARTSLGWTEEGRFEGLN